MIHKYFHFLSLSILGLLFMGCPSNKTPVTDKGKGLSIALTTNPNNGGDCKYITAIVRFDEKIQEMPSRLIFGNWRTQGEPGNLAAPNLPETGWILAVDSTELKQVIEITSNWATNPEAYLVNVQVDYSPNPSPMFQDINVGIDMGNCP